MPRRAVQQGSDVSRGWEIGSQIGKGLSGLGEAIQKAQAQAKQDAAANAIMNAGPTGQDPTPQFLGKLGGGDGSSQDLGTLPADQTFTNPSTGNVEPLSTGDDNAAIPMPASTGSGSTVGSQMDQPATSTSDNWSLSDLQGGGTTLPGESGITGPTVGSLIHSGGAAELATRQAMQKSALADAIQRATLGKTQAQTADVLARTAGTGRYAPKPAAPGKPAPVGPAVNIGSEPVTDQDQLTNFIDKIYGKGAATDMASTMNEGPTIPDPDDPSKTIPNPNAPVVTGNSVTVGPAKNRMTLPLAQAQQLVKQQNALLLMQGLPAYRVPGEDQTVGATADNPYIAKTNLDVYSRAPADEKGNGGWVRLPNGKISHLVRQPNGQIRGQQN
jgi:hypothetical protein